MLLPWTSRGRLIKIKNELEEELAELRETTSKEKKKVKRMEKDLYWGEVSLSEMKSERKRFVRVQKRTRSVKKRLAAIDQRLGSKEASKENETHGID